MSAQRASETPSTVTSLARDRVASLRTVQVPGSPATYANRAYLCALGLRWDPEHHRWHGTTTAEAVKTLREQLHLEVRVFGALEGAPKGPAAPKPVLPLRPAPSPIAVTSCDPQQRLHDGTRTRAEARVAYPASCEEPDEIVTPGRRFNILEITSGLPDDSREADEKSSERRVRDLRARVKRARAVVATTPGLEEQIASDWRRAARFYARFGITETTYRQGAFTGEGTTAGLRHPADALVVTGEWAEGALLSIEYERRPPG